MKATKSFVLELDKAYTDASTLSMITGLKHKVTIVSKPSIVIRLKRIRSRLRVEHLGWTYKVTNEVVL